MNNGIQYVDPRLLQKNGHMIQSLYYTNTGPTILDTDVINTTNTTQIINDPYQFSDNELVDENEFHVSIIKSIEPQTPKLLSSTKMILIGTGIIILLIVATKK